MRIVVIILTGFILITSCNRPGQEENRMQIKLSIIEEQEAILSADEMVVFDHAINAAKAYQDYFFSFPEDSIRNPKFMAKASQLYSSVEKYDSAIVNIQRLRATYPRTSSAANMLHYKAFVIYQEGLKDKRNARKHYHEFLELYPRHDLFPAVLFALENLDTDESDWLRRIRDFQLNEDEYVEYD